MSSKTTSKHREQSAINLKVNTITSNRKIKRTRKDTDSSKRSCPPCTSEIKKN